ncbi:hypothetical protein PT974_02903 [Cladobotryum mycophilum]|uniref:Zn(2)-C6 fungal-type domain-containing protein n=1 Tax=Cladobotryum mycophilum TaxID=491253 RepID=A0ABR0SZC2_9HYPO
MAHNPSVPLAFDNVDLEGIDWYSFNDDQHDFGLEAPFALSESTSDNMQLMDWPFHGEQPDASFTDITGIDSAEIPSLNSLPYPLVDSNPVFDPQDSMMMDPVNLANTLNLYKPHPDIGNFDGIFPSISDLELNSPPNLNSFNLAEQEALLFSGRSSGKRRSGTKANPPTPAPAVIATPIAIRKRSFNRFDEDHSSEALTEMPWTKSIKMQGVPDGFCFAMNPKVKPDAMANTSSDRPKAQRASKACLRCRLDKVKCSMTLPCERCQQFLRNATARRSDQAVYWTACLDFDIKKLNFISPLSINISRIGISADNPFLITDL